MWNNENLQSWPKVCKTACRTDKFLFKFDLILNAISPAPPFSVFFYSFSVPVIGLLFHLLNHEVEVTATLNRGGGGRPEHARKMTHRSIVFVQDCSSFTVKLQCSPAREIAILLRNVAILIGRLLEQVANGFRKLPLVYFICYTFHLLYNVSGDNTILRREICRVFCSRTDSRVQRPS